MAMGKRREKQQALWIATKDVLTGPGNVFYDRLNKILDQHKFDRKVERLCRRFYKDSAFGRPSMAPGVYFRLLLIGYFEGLDSERGIAWRVADSLSLRQFLGFALDEQTPDHSTISRTRRLYWLSTHSAVFKWVIKILTGEGLIQGQTIAIDATTLEANAAMKNIVRRDNGQSYNDYLKGLAKAAGIENPTREELARLDRKRKKKGSNEEWESPADPDARITKMKDGRTHLAHKAEHAVDLSSGAVMAITLAPADQGDTTSIHKTLAEAQSVARQVNPLGVEEVVADKGYHSGEVLKTLHNSGVRSYLPEPQRRKRNWEGKAVEQKRTYENRRRIRGSRGKQLQKERSELTERTFAHMYETGGMRRVHLRGRDNILKRLLVHGAAFNLSLVLRKDLGAGTPREFQKLYTQLFALIWMLWDDIMSRMVEDSGNLGAVLYFISTSTLDLIRQILPNHNQKNETTTTGC
jgi:transposase